MRLAPNSYSLAKTSDNLYLFSGDEGGNIHQWSIINNELVKIYQKTHKQAISSIVVTPDNQYFFSADNQGHLVQWLIKDNRLIKDFGNIHKFAINMVVTVDSKN